MTIIQWLITALAIGLAAMLLPGVDVNPIGALLLAVVLALINMFIKPIINLLTLPLNIVTLGLFSLVVNALLIMLAAMVVPGFSVDNFWWALIFAILLALISALFGAGLRRR
ncbi:MAG TPA: phage holin family protein [Candidatus Paceibacterota bacterium]|nr:phage holin family protein [Candidatus Paceibacterota bacterium]